MGNDMRRFRLGTLMPFVVIAALATALAVQQRRASRREAAMQSEIASYVPRARNCRRPPIGRKSKPWSLKRKRQTPARRN